MHWIIFLFIGAVVFLKNPMILVWALVAYVVFMMIKQWVQR